VRLWAFAVLLIMIVKRGHHQKHTKGRNDITIALNLRSERVTIQTNPFFRLNLKRSPSEFMIDGIKFEVGDRFS
jgi:hypothetical protein